MAPAYIHRGVPALTELRAGEACAGSQGPCEPPRALLRAPCAPARNTCLPAPQSEACRPSVPERDKAAKHCCVQLPDGTSCVVVVKAGLSIKEVLTGLCERHGINGAAVDLFLVGGDKVWGCVDPRGPSPARGWGWGEWRVCSVN